MKIKKAVIAAAGRGTRFLPVTKAYPKELLPIYDRPQIQVLVEECVEAGATEIAIVTSGRDTCIEDYFKKDENLEKYLKENKKEGFLLGLNSLLNKIGSLVFIKQPKDLAYGTGAPLLSAADFIGNDPFFYLYGDDLVLEKTTGNYLKKLSGIFFERKTAAVVGVSKVPWSEVKNFGTVKFRDKRNLEMESILEKMEKENAPSNFVMFGRFACAPRVLSVLKGQKTKKGGELMFTETLTGVAKEKLVIAKPVTDEKWLTTGDQEHWFNANREFRDHFLK